MLIYSIIINKGMEWPGDRSAGQIFNISLMAFPSFCYLWFTLQIGIFNLYIHFDRQSIGIRPIYLVQIDIPNDDPINKVTL
jgi:hypothetical protein